MPIPEIFLLVGSLLTVDGLLILFYKPYFAWWSRKFWDNGDYKFMSKKGTYFYNKYARSFRSLIIGLALIGIVFFVR